MPAKNFDKGNIWIKSETKAKNIFLDSDRLSNLLNSQADTTNPLGQIDSLRTDSLLVVQTPKDTIATDSTKIDSTARLNQFKYVRKDNEYLEVEPKRKLSLYVYPSQRQIRRTVELDSTGNNVIIKEFIANNEVRSKLIIPLDEYIKLRMDAISRKNWEDLGYKYELKKSKDDLGKFLTDITNIEIPLPSVSFLSIFGPPKISLKINGAVDIHGAWRNETTEGVTASLLGNTRNEPDFKQQVQINVNGIIGDKLTIRADWNTERTFEYENQLKLQYTGYDDEIVKNVEAGNVSLQTSPLVGGGEALFGIKALFQFGPFSLTALASQKKSEIEEVSVTGGSQKNEFSIRAYEYSQSHYFVDTLYASTKPELNLFSKYFANANPIIEPFYRIKQLEVWKTTSGNLDISTQRWGNAFIDLEGRDATENPNPYPQNLKDRTTNNNPIPGRSVIGERFIPLKEETDYEYNPYTGFISFKTQISNEDAIAVAYRLEGPDGPIDKYYGEFLTEIANDTSATLVLKLIKPKKLQPGGDFNDAWKLQLKNIYPIGGRDVKKEGFKLDINFEVPGAEPVNNFDGNNFLETFGLDITDESAAGDPDGAFDWDPGRTILPKTGEIIFPVLQPFGRQFPEIYDQSLRYNAVYDTSITFAKNDKAQDKFVIVGEYSALASSVYNIGFNVVENSVKVLLNGRELRLGQDYSVDYNIGQVVIRNEDALVTGANLKITYEKNDLFQLASKTLIGLRGLYDLSEKTKFGFSYLNLNQTTLSDKVRIGEEPLNNAILGLDFQTGFDLPFITKGLDYLISTKEMSSFKLNGEFAYISPDPNTKKSKIVSDDKKSIAYIDDFEGAKRTIPIGVSYTGWRDISVPDDIPGINNIAKPLQMSYKAKSYWYNILPSNVFVQDIWGDRRQTSRENNQITVLDYVFLPDQRGSYNYAPTLENKILNWGGMMRPLSSTASNLVEENIEFIEFWLYVGQAPESAKLIIDLGQISEDIIPNGILDAEDKNQNDRLDEGEDTGIDGLTDGEERAKYPDFGEDPSNDNFSFTLGSGDYTKINGTEGNGKLSDVGRIPDSEDMNKNFTLDRVNSYFRYEIPLDTNKEKNGFISGGGDNKGWFQFRIPLREFTKEIGNPSLTIVETIRFWVSDVEEPIYLRFAELNLVGNQWQKIIKPGFVEEDDTTLVISTINIEDNPEYTSPPGVFRERDRSQPDYEIFKNEQSLKLVITDLDDGDKREISKFLFRPLDVFSYKEMKLFVHGDLNDNPGSISFFRNSDNYGSEVYFRFGTDTSNFYEYRQPVKADWNEISILFSELTAIKQARANINELYQIPVSNQPGHFYGIKGNPTLTRINYFSFGILNPKQSEVVGDKVSGELWINELRVLDADDSKGWAYSASSSIKFADLMTVSINASQTDPYFHRLNDRFGTRVDNSRWSGAVNFDVIKLLPWNLTGSNFGISYTRTESSSKPLFLPGTDVNVDQAVSQESKKLIDGGYTESEAQSIANEIKKNSQTLNISDTWSISSIRFKLPTNDWYVQDIINNLQFSFNYNKSFSRSPSLVFSNSWVWNGAAKYSLNFGKDNYFFLANIPIIGAFFELFEDYKNVKIYFTPQNFNTGLSANRKNASSISRTTDAKINTQRDFGSKRDFNFNWKISEGGLLNLSTSYNVAVSSSYAHLLAIEDIARPERDIWNDIFRGPLFGKDYNYTQSFDLKTNPKLPNFWDLNRYLTITFGYGANYNWSNNFRQEDLGRSAGYSNSIRAGLTLKLKQLTAPLFAETVTQEKSQTQKKSPTPARGRSIVKKADENEDVPKPKEITEDNDSSTVQDSVEVVPKTPIFLKAYTLLKDASKWLLFDYENINFNFSQSNSSSGSGLRSTGTGFANFWGFKFDDNSGPSRAFMLGLSNDLGSRAPRGNLSDNFSQKNSIDFKTSRPLWEGADIDINWRVSWGFNRTTRIHTDDEGNVFIDDVTSTGNLDRSFIYLPIFISKSGVVEVNDLYSRDPNKNIAAAFIEGFESMPFLSKLPILKDVAKYIPRANWRINWRGLEKISFIKDLAKSVSLNHSYNSSYTEGWKVDPDGKRQVQTQRISYGFSPLLGLNITFDNIWEGNLNGSIKYSTKSNFDLGVATKNITESFSRDINVTASFSKSGFELPLFGLSLKNDIEMSLSYTSVQNSIVIFEMENFNEEGKPQDGTTRTIIEPRIKYTLSSKVSLSIFYKRTSVEPKGASRIPPTTTNEAGLDVHISIQGS